MSDAVWIAIIGSATTVITALLSRKQSEKKSDAPEDQAQPPSQATRARRRRIAFSTTFAIGISLTALLAATLPWLRANPPALSQTQVDEWISQKTSAEQSSPQSGIIYVGDTKICWGVADVGKYDGSMYPNGWRIRRVAFDFPKSRPFTDAPAVTCSYHTLENVGGVFPVEFRRETLDASHFQALLVAMSYPDSPLNEQTQGEVKNMKMTCSYVAIGKWR